MPTLTTELEDALGFYMTRHAVDRDEAIRRILAAWLGANDYLAGADRPADHPEETVQYPEFMDDASGGSGG